MNSTRSASGTTSYRYCTNAFPLTNAVGNKFVLTAGHCYVTGERIYNGIPPSIGIGGWSSNLIGTVYTRTYNTGYPDAGLIAADGSRGLWTGSSASPTRTTTIDAFLNPWSGMPLCIDGAYEGEVCSLKVGNPDHVVCVGIASSSSGSLAATCNNWTAFGRICTSGVNIQNIGPILTQWGLSLDP